MASLPSRERGLKYARDAQENGSLCVAPLAGAWIEILSFRPPFRPLPVAPLAGAWIEISKNLAFLFLQLCRSPRGRVD